MSGGVRDGWAGECSASPMHGSVLIESSHDPSSGGYAYDSVTPGQAVMERDTGTAHFCSNLSCTCDCYHDCSVCCHVSSHPQKASQLYMISTYCISSSL